MSSRVTAFPHLWHVVLDFGHVRSCSAISSRCMTWRHPLFLQVIFCFPHSVGWPSAPSNVPLHSQPTFEQCMTNFLVIWSRQTLVKSWRGISKRQTGHFGLAPSPTSTITCSKQVLQPECPHVKVTGLNMTPRLQTFQKYRHVNKDAFTHRAYSSIQMGFHSYTVISLISYQMLHARLASTSSENLH